MTPDVAGMQVLQKLKVAGWRNEGAILERDGSISFEVGASRFFGQTAQEIACVRTVTSCFINQLEWDRRPVRFLPGDDSLSPAKDC